MKTSQKMITNLLLPFMAKEKSFWLCVFMWYFVSGCEMSCYVELAKIMDFFQYFFFNFLEKYNFMIFNDILSNFIFINQYFQENIKNRNFIFTGHEKGHFCEIMGSWNESWFMNRLAKLKSLLRRKFWLGRSQKRTYECIRKILMFYKIIWNT